MLIVFFWRRRKILWDGRRFSCDGLAAQEILVLGMRVVSITIREKGCIRDESLLK